MIKAIDLFAGAGGLSYGFKMTGEFQFVAAAEINKDAQKTYIKNIVTNPDQFEMIDNVIGYDFSALNERYGGIDAVIGGPPCQGFSNANRQKNHIISMNNSLVKEFFRAIRQICPKVFVMENVSMLKSDVHRFYESAFDNEEIAALSIPKRPDTLVLTQYNFKGIDLSKPETLLQQNLLVPEKLSHMLNVLRKDLHNPRRLPNFMKKNGQLISEQIEQFFSSNSNYDTQSKKYLCMQLELIKTAIKSGCPENAEDAIIYVVNLQKLLESIQEIQTNKLIGEYVNLPETGLVFRVNSYSVIDYINAILGDDYIQKGETINAEWFGVPQERKRHIIIGIRKDIYNEKGIKINFPKKGKTKSVNVGEALDDLSIYEVNYRTDSPPIKYKRHGPLSAYARKMRRGSKYITNHVTTKTGQIALNRFEKISQGENFHSLNADDKSTYSKPERTQNTIYLRLDPNQPAKTVVNVRKSMWIHPTLNRAITVREAARLQSFPDKFEFIGSKDSQFQQVGNAVPPLLARRIAIVILKYL